MAKKKKQEEAKAIDLTQETSQEVPSMGLGDTIAKITKFFGIEPCEGCKSRQAQFNKLFPYLNPIRHLTQEEVAFIDKVNTQKMMQNDEANRLFSLYNEVFPSKRPIQRCNCPGTILKLIERLHLLAHINDTE